MSLKVLNLFNNLKNYIIHVLHKFVKQNSGTFDTGYGTYE